MDQSSYPISTINNKIFEFTSIGKSQIRQQVSFVEIDKITRLYNVGLSIVTKDGDNDYESLTNNGDVVKIFMAVINCIKIFFKDFPDSIVYFKGNTEQKNRVYNEIIRRHFEEFSKDFRIFGTNYNEGIIIVDEFDSTKNYSGFYIELKK